MQKLLRLAYKNMGPMLFVNAAAAVGALLALHAWWNPLLLAWFVFQIVITAIRVFFWKRFQTLHRNGAATGQPLLWKIIYGVGLITSGSAWSILAVSLIISGVSMKDGAELYTVLIIISALAGGASGITSPLKPLGMTYLTVLLCPPSVALIADSPSSAILGVLGLIFWVVMLFALNNNHTVLSRSLALEENNQTLVEQLGHLNSELEVKVAERTQRLNVLANTDNLTGLLNRHGLDDWWSRLMVRDPATEALVFFMDLDRFKHVNDALGHEAGDRLLTVIAHRTRLALPVSAALARWGGDEFVVVFPCSGNMMESVASISQRITEAVNLPVDFGGQALKLGVSIGWASFPEGTRSIADAIHAADLAVTEIKRTQRGMVLAYSETFAETMRRRFELSRALSDAIGSDAISLVYQPIINVQTGAIEAREALARWQHPELGAIQPDEFIRLAEDTDRIVALGDWVLRQACLDAVAWAGRGCGARVAVNISIRQLVADSFQMRLLRILAETGLLPSRLDLEVTESVFDDEHIDRIACVLRDLKILGVRIHIDDFGTGYSSLSRLNRLTVDAIKIDKSFVSDIDGQGRVIIESAVMIARSFGLKVIAEGVETPGQVAKLRSIGVDALQGYLFGVPGKVVVGDDFIGSLLSGVGSNDAVRAA